MGELSSFLNAGQVDRKVAQAKMLETIREIKADRARYDQLKEQLKGKTSDAERAEVLVDFITKHDDLVTALPSGEQEVALTWMTVTVTTVFIFAGSAY